MYDSQSAVQILHLIQEMLPHVSALNLLAGNQLEMIGNISSQELEACVHTTSQHYTWVQSDHPYKPATVSNYRFVYRITY